MRTTFALILVFQSLLVIPAAAVDVDWKWYGGFAFGGVEQQCFYEERGLVKEPNAMFRFWTKCLRKTDLDRDFKKTPYYNSVMSMSASRIAHYYFPPIEKAEKLNIDQIMNIVLYESLADIAGFESTASILYEMNCRQKQLRELDITVGTHSTSVPREWSNGPPESNGGNLLAMLCPLT